MRARAPALPVLAYLFLPHHFLGKAAPGTDLILKFPRALSALETMKVGEIIWIEE